jgi:hypothetical protein
MADTWQVRPADEGVWVRREPVAGWTIEHRIVRSGRSLVIVESRIRPSDPARVDADGLDAALLRDLTVIRGAREAAEGSLPRPAEEDLRRLEALTPSGKPRGEARRWRLALTAWAYVEEIRRGSHRPNEAVAAALGIRAEQVRDRIHAARQHDPPLLTGGGQQGLVGQPELSEAGWGVLEARIERAVAANGDDPARSRLLGFRGTLAAFDAMWTSLIRNAEARIPGLWEMDLEEVVDGAAGLTETIEVPAGKGLRVGREGYEVVDVDETGKPR